MLNDSINLTQNMNDKEKKTFNDMAEKDRVRYEVEMKNYHPPEGKQRKKKKKDPNAPKRPQYVALFVLFFYVTFSLSCEIGFKKQKAVCKSFFVPLVKRCWLISASTILRWLWIDHGYFHCTSGICMCGRSPGTVPK